MPHGKSYPKREIFFDGCPLENYASSRRRLSTALASASPASAPVRARRAARAGEPAGKRSTSPAGLAHERRLTRFRMTQRYGSGVVRLSHLQNPPMSNSQDTGSVAARQVVQLSSGANLTRTVLGYLHASSLQEEIRACGSVLRTKVPIINLTGTVLTPDCR